MQSSIFSPLRNGASLTANSLQLSPLYVYRLSPWDASTANTYRACKEFPLPPGSILYDTYNVGVYDTDANKVKDSPSNLKKEEKVSQPKYERSE